MSNSQILANGADGQKGDAEQGSGGGAGGTISVQTRHLKGESTIEAKGGNGSDGGGGGGAGGRMAVHFLSGYTVSE